MIDLFRDEALVGVIGERAGDVVLDRHRPVGNLDGLVQQGLALRNFDTSALVLYRCESRKEPAIVGSVGGDGLDLVLDGAARRREGSRTVPSPRIDSFIRLFNSPARPPLRVNRPTVTSESIWGRPA